MEEKKKKNWILNKVKSGLSLLADSCVMACTTAGTAAAVPITMINPILGVAIVIGNLVATSALAETIIDPWVSETVDNLANMPNEIRESVKDSVDEIKDVVNNIEKETQENEGKAE